MFKGKIINTFRVSCEKLSRLALKIFSTSELLIYMSFQRDHESQSIFLMVQALAFHGITFCPPERTVRYGRRGIPFIL